MTGLTVFTQTYESLSIISYDDHCALCSLNFQYMIIFCFSVTTSTIGAYQNENSALNTARMTAMKDRRRCPVLAESTHSAMLPQSGLKNRIMGHARVADRKARKKPIGRFKFTRNDSAAVWAIE